jgi:hypothetical protein
VYYEINVALRGRHFFATAERSITTRAAAAEVYWLFVRKFPDSEGYTITVSQRSTTGTEITPEELPNEA